VEQRRENVKKLLRWGVLATALLVVAGAPARSLAQGQTLPATKVGVVNLGILFTKYEKAAMFKKEIDAELAPLKLESEKIRDLMKKHQEWIEKFGNTDPAQKEKSLKALKDGARALEDLDLNARKVIGKKQETQVIQLYKEIHAGVSQYAVQNGFHVIFAYGDPPDQDPFTFQTINRRMGGLDIGAAVPYYWQTGLDISNEVLARLNAGYRPTAGGPLTAPTAPINPASFNKQP
jgi:Skp family chaperone for outer membrane proteins